MYSDIAKIVDSIVYKWSHNKDILAVILTGSFVLGTSSPNSDIDVLIIAREGLKRRRGNYYKDNRLIEYFVETESFLQKQMASDYEDNQKATARMIITGEAVYVKDNYSVNGIVNFAKDYFKKEFKPLTQSQVEDRKYWLWDSMDGLIDAYDSKSPVKYFLSSLHTSLLIQVYCFFFQLEVPHMAKVYKIITNDKFRSKYQIEPFDEKFTSRLLECLVDLPTLDAEKQLTDYVQKCMGGFDISAWSVVYNK